MYLQNRAKQTANLEPLGSMRHSTSHTFGKATPFQRIWCCFEQSVALTSTRAQRMLLDIATAEQGSDSAVIITDGATWICRAAQGVLWFGPPVS